MWDSADKPLVKTTGQILAWKKILFNLCILYCPKIDGFYEVWGLAEENAVLIDTNISGFHLCLNVF